LNRLDDRIGMTRCSTHSARSGSYVEFVDTSSALTRRRARQASAWSGDSEVLAPAAHPYRSAWLRIGAALALTLVAVGSARAQPAPEPALKAAFVYTFAKFVEWPVDALPAKAPLTMCIGDRGVADALEQIVAGRSIEQHGLVVTRVTAATNLRSCQILYLGDLDARRSADLVAALQGASALTISDFDGFTALGGVIHFFADHGSMRFAINLESAQRARLHVSSRLLGLASIVKDARHAG
jgi:hypothetical protein